AVITAISSKEATLDIKQVRMENREPVASATLYSALLKRENFELVCQKATELGIARIVPLHTERTVKTGFNRSRLEKIIQEACEQSGRTRVPELMDPMEFKEALTRIETPAVLFDHSGTPYASFDFATPNLSVFIGPEGGF